LNHPQYVAGPINDVFPVQGGSSLSRSILTPGDPSFGQFNAQGGQFSANPRTMQLAFKVIF
jgi:hypothetical protein